jgi:hydroxyacylglutathione hydrolase
VPHSTLGYERRFNWAFRIKSEAEFVDAVLAGQPDPPKYFATMKRMNKEGPRVIGDAARDVVRRNDAELAAVIARGALVIDTRPAAEYATGFVPGTINLPMNNAFVTWAGWLIPYDQEFYLLLGGGAETRLAEVVRALALIGLDRIGGYFASSALAVATASLPLGVIPQIAPDALAQMRGDHVPVVIDVRADSEWNAGHLPAAVHVPLGRLSDRIAELPKGQPLVMQCGAGARSAIAASVLRRAGFPDVSNLVGGYQAWVDAGLPTSRSGAAGPP